MNWHVVIISTDKVPIVGTLQTEPGYIHVFRMFYNSRFMIPDSPFTRWWFQTFFIFTPIWGRFPNLTNIFQMGWFNHQPVYDSRDFKRSDRIISHDCQEGPSNRKGLQFSQIHSMAMGSGSKLIGRKKTCQDRKNKKYQHFLKKIRHFSSSNLNPKEFLVVNFHRWLRFPARFFFPPRWSIRVRLPRTPSVQKRWDA